MHDPGVAHAQFARAQNQETSDTTQAAEEEADPECHEIDIDRFGAQNRPMRVSKFGKTTATHLYGVRSDLGSRLQQSEGCSRGDYGGAGTKKSPRAN